MTEKLYLECAGGISGDMTVAALLGLGGNRETLNSALQSLQLEGLRWEISEEKSYGISGINFNVILPEHHHEGHHHTHRNLNDVFAVLDRGSLTPAANHLAHKIFRIIAEAEAKAHGAAIEEIHFHEVGALDSIADIAAAAVLADDLGITECIVTGLTEGSGFVHCAHGDLPVPVPAVVNIAERFQIPLRPSDTNGEMVTPTGIAIAAAMRTQNKLPAEYMIRKTGIGLGKRDFGHPNILRAMLIREAQMPDQIWQIECNIDDSTGEMLGAAMDELFAAGACDVHYTPCFMKKNRPAWLLTVIVKNENLDAVEHTIFRTTTTIGLRKQPVQRTCMERATFDLKLPYGTVQIKRCSYDGILRNYPEYESVLKTAKSAGLSYAEVFTEAKAAAEQIR